MAGNLVGVVEAAGAVIVAGSIVVGAYHRYVVMPARSKADDAMAKSRQAYQEVNEVRDDVDTLDSDLRESLDELSESIDTLVKNLDEQRREFRGQTYQVYTLARAINESEELPDVPVPDEDQFLRGGDAD